ncbi:hypothetical protein [Citrobacter arsenatis]|uniref:hypothetical protein n=1 Tax=Citrobacter arsenatis TaxID=2546350 RepID=UPI00300E34B0
MDNFKIVTLLLLIIMDISASQAANSQVRNDSLSVKGFDFSDENLLNAKDIYGSCYRLEEPLLIDLTAAGNGVAFKKSWSSKVRFTLAQSKVISPNSPGNLSAKNTPDGITWIDDGIGLWDLGYRKIWSTVITGKGTVQQEGWEVGTISVNDNTVSRKVRIPTRNLQTLEFIFTSEANRNDVHIMFERQPGTNYMKNTTLWYPEGGNSINEVESDAKNKIKLTGDAWAPYDGFNLVRVERISFRGYQWQYEPSHIEVGAYEVGFKVEPDTEKYGFTARQYDEACK